MGADVTIEALGVRIRLDLSALNADDATAVHFAWRDAVCAPGDEAEGDRHVVLAVEPDGNRAWWLPELSRRVTRTAIEVRKGEGWMLHAAGLADAEGRVAAVIGGSGAGKTTAVRALAGNFAYVSDETVFVDADGAVLAYRKPLSIVTGEGAPKSETPASEEGMRVDPGSSLRLGALVLLDRRPGLPAPVVERLPLDEALAQLVAQSSYLPLWSRPLQAITHLVAATGGVYRVSYTEAQTLAPAITGLLASPPVAAEASAALATDAVVDEPVAGDDARYRRAHVDDAIAFPASGRLAILQGGALRVLDGVGPTLWYSADGRTADELASALIATHGEPDDAAAATTEALATLEAAGLIVAAGSGYRVHPDIAWVDSMTGDAVVLSLGDWRRAAPLSLGGSGSLIWRVIAATPGADIATITRAVADEYFTLPDDFAAHVERFVAGLHERRLLARV